MDHGKPASGGVTGSIRKRFTGRIKSLSGAPWKDGFPSSPFGTVTNRRPLPAMSQSLNAEVPTAMNAVSSPAQGGGLAPSVSPYF